MDSRAAKRALERRARPLAHRETVHRDEALAVERGLAVGGDLAPALAVGRRRARERDGQQALPQRGLRLALRVLRRRDEHARDAADRAAAVRLLERVALAPRLEVRLRLPDRVRHVVHVVVRARVVDAPQHAEEPEAGQRPEPRLAVGARVSNAGSRPFFTRKRFCTT